MANENIIIGHIEQALIDKLNTALTSLTAAQTLFIDTVAQLNAHNVEADSHLDIRQDLLELKIGTGFLTVEDGEAKIATAVTAHDTSALSHPDLRTVIADLRNALDALTIRIVALEPTEEEEELSELERRLAAVDAYYDPTLAALLSAWQVASMQGLPTADSIADQYQTLLTEKAEARATVLREFSYE